MFVDFSKTDNHPPSSACTLQTIYLLTATKEYHVFHEPLAQRQVLIYTFGGAGRLSYRGNQIDLPVGSLLLFDPQNDAFEYYTTQSAWCFWWFEFRANAMPLTEGELYSIQLDHSFLGTMSKIFSLHKQQYYEYAATVFCGMIAEISYQIQSLDASNRSKKLLYQLQEDIQANLAEITVQALAEHAHISDKTVRTLFHEFCDQSPKAYITAAKMQSAQYYLRSTQTSVSAISELLGYSSPFHFCKAFKQFTHTTPTLYRKQAST